MLVIVRLQDQTLPFELPANARVSQLSNLLSSSGMTFSLHAQGRILSETAELDDKMIIDAFVPADGAGKDKKRKKKAHKTPKKIKHKPKKIRLACLKYYTIKGDTAEPTHEYCPNCGPGIRIARHKDRCHCGRCGFAKQTLLVAG
ncbi:Ribosomal protein S27a [Giardia lamblia P15]|uniref:Ribosomal protein S27a n=1 Tax=Giardia intestinalis (strain P15) TaxID=658858 RepID=E1F0P1_GIAIA|nr:Ribosomal protein S27a [Giardia lamblia P15]